MAKWSDILIFDQKFLKGRIATLVGKHFEAVRRRSMSATQLQQSNVCFSDLFHSTLDFFSLPSFPQFSFAKSHNTEENFQLEVIHL